MVGGRDEKGEVQLPSPAAWRAQLLQGLLTIALIALSITVPIGVIKTGGHRSPPTLVLTIALYSAVFVATFARRGRYVPRALALLAALAALSFVGFLRVGFLIGPGAGCALFVVTAGLLLGQRAMWAAFALTLAAMAGMGWLHERSGGAYLARAVTDPTLMANWLRLSVIYGLLTIVLASSVTFVVRRIEHILSERTAALAALRAEQAQRIETETALGQAQGTIEQMQKLEAVGRLAGGVAHDFNNALVVILGWADAMRRMRDDQQRDKALDRIVAAGSRAARLTQQLLTIGRKAVSVPKALSPGALIEEVARFVERVLPENIRLETEVEDTSPPIFADASQIHHVLLNLCLNARDAMPDGGELFIRARRFSSDGRDGVPAGTFCALDVRDTGCGMDRITLDRAFEPFFTTKGELGTGLGLSTVHGIVTQSGGHVRVKSAPGQGTTLTVLLPLAGEMPSEEVAQLSPTLPHTRATVLVAEDDRAVREVMVDALREAGHEVLSAGDGDAALELARRYRGRIDLLCSDGVMPGLNTAELISGFRHLFPNAPVLVCSGHVREDDLRHRVEARDVRYLGKPFTGRALAEAVAESLAAALRVS
jgi:signal transduction histidine kinase/CheY-like chemotaxis protein